MALSTARLQKLAACSALLREVAAEYGFGLRVEVPDDLVADYEEAQEASGKCLAILRALKLQDLCTALHKYPYGFAEWCVVFISFSPEKAASSCCSTGR